MEIEGELAFQIKEDPFVGRCLVANKPLEQGEEIITELPIGIKKLKLYQK